MMPRSYPTVPTLAEFDAIARRVFGAMPVEFRRMCEGIIIQTSEFADDGTLDAMEIDSPYGLLGLYSGVDITRKSIMQSGGTPDMVFLYRQPILAFARQNDEDLLRVIAHVLIHEIGHHFGLSDDDMHELQSD